MESSGLHHARRAAARLALGSACIAVGACAHLRPQSPESAVTVARRGVCGAPGSPTESGCTVRGVERAGDAYRVLIDRRPPAGNDRLAVLVRGGSIEVISLGTLSDTTPP